MELPNIRMTITILAVLVGVTLVGAELASASVKVPPGGGYSIVFQEGNGAGTPCTNVASDGTTDTFPPGSTATVTTYNADGSVASTTTYTCDGSDGNWVSSARTGGSFPGVPVLATNSIAIGPPSSKAITVCSPDQIALCIPIINPWPPKALP